jgi:hypothetical protein
MLFKDFDDDNRAATNVARVLNLIRKVDMTTVSGKKWAVIRLLEWQPTARRIRFEGKCHCRGQYLMSYQTNDIPVSARGDDEETCGYYCPSCGFGNAGSRKRSA